MFKYFIFLPLFYAKSILKFQESKFRILQLTDLHFGMEEDQKNIEVIRNILIFTKPDLVIVTGDIVSGWRWNGEVDYFKSIHQKFILPFQELNVKYILIVGNHDTEADLNAQEIMSLDSSIEQSFTMYSPFYRMNYFVPIYNDQGDQEIYRIWGIYSEDYACLGHSGSYGCITKDTIDAYLQTEQESQHTMIALHIPPPEFVDLYQNYPTFGEIRENVTCPLVNTGFIDAVLEKQNAQYLICGHDHQNDYGGLYPGMNSEITLMFGIKSGISGEQLCCGQKPGGRVFDLTHENGNVIVDHFKVDYENQTYKNNTMWKKDVDYELKCQMIKGPSFQLIQQASYFIIGYLVLLLISSIVSFFIYKIKLSKQEQLGKNIEMKDHQTKNV